MNKKFLGKLVPLLFGVALLASLWSRFSLEQVHLAFQQVGWLLLPMLFMAFLWLPWDTFTTSRLLRPGSMGFRLLLLEWSADSLSILIPLAGMGGEPFRIRHLPDYTDQPLKVAVACRAMHAWGGLLTAIMGAALCWLTGQPGLPWGTLAVVGGLLFVGGLVAFGRAQQRFWVELPGRRLLTAFAIKMVGRTLQVAEVALILLALGVPLTWSGLLLIQSSLMAAASLFAFIPGGLGVHESALLSACQHAGLSQEIGFQLGLIRRVRQVGWASAGMLAVFYLERTRSKLTLAEGSVQL